MTQEDKRNIETVRRMYDGNEAERANIAATIVWHVPGHNPFSGEYRGFEEYTMLMPGRMAPLWRWDFTLGEIMVNGNFVMTTLQLQGERKGIAISIRGGHLFRLDTAEKVVEGWGFTDDQEALDRFFAA